LPIAAVGTVDGPRGARAAVRSAPRVPAPGTWRRGDWTNAQPTARQRGQLLLPVLDRVLSCRELHSRLPLAVHRPSGPEYPATAPDYQRVDLARRAQLVACVDQLRFGPRQSIQYTRARSRRHVSLTAFIG